MSRKIKFLYLIFKFAKFINIGELFFRESNYAEVLIGALTERNIPGGLFGPTLSCIAIHQFWRIKNGDRFWYSNKNLVPAFTLGKQVLSDLKVFKNWARLKNFSKFAAQLKEISQVSMSDLMCSNVDGDRAVQENAFLMPDPET